MKEPVPQKISPPKRVEPKLRVGIVLKEDKKSSLTFSVPTEDFALIADNKELGLSALQDYKIVNRAGTLLLESTIFDLAPQTGRLQILNFEPGDLKPHSGISIDGVIAGRGFHWQKEISQTLPGNLEIIADGDHLVVVNTVSFEDYLACVVSSEMSSSCPIEFSKAQIVAARSWATVFLSGKHPEAPFDICNDDDCQRYQGTTYLSPLALEATAECKGEFLITEDGFVCPAYYSKSCGGHGETSQNTFGFKTPGLRAIFDLPKEKTPSLDLREEEDFRTWLGGDPELIGPAYCSSTTVKEEKLKDYIGVVDETGKYYRWEYSISGSELIQNLRIKFDLTGVEKIVDLVPGPRGTSGRITSLTIKYKDESGKEQELFVENQYNIREALHKSFLYSTAFIFEISKSPGGAVTKIDFKGLGWGHAVGLCQIGALGMALSQYSYKEILKHYYPETTLKKMY